MMVTLVNAGKLSLSCFPLIAGHDCLLILLQHFLGYIYFYKVAVTPFTQIQSQLAMHSYDVSLHLLAYKCLCNI